MDAQRFDSLVRALGAAATRRGALGALLSGVVAPLFPHADADAGRGRGKGRGKGHGGGNGKGRGKSNHAKARHHHKGKGKDRIRNTGRQEQNKTQAAAACYTGSPCVVGPSKNLTKCDLSNSAALKNKNCAKCNLTGANLRKADVAGTNLNKANLSNACLVEANLANANLTGANLNGAIFCRTRMPNGSLNNSGCTKGTACCPTCAAIGASCANGASGGCCGGATCQSGVCTCPANTPNNCGGVCKACCDDADCDSDVCCQSVCCGSGEVCVSGQCCQPDCQGKVCGVNGCGGTCGACPPNASCTSDGTAGVCDFLTCGSACCTEDQRCCGNQCVTGICCDADDCETRTCEVTTCTAGHNCAYEDEPDLTACTTESITTGVCCAGDCYSGNCCEDGDCPSPGSNRCASHTCQCGTSAPCSGSTPDCCGEGNDATCTDTDTDVNNCGGCGEVCGLQQVCDGGECACPCPDMACFITKWGTPGSGDGQFNWPSSVAIAPDGTVYVPDYNNHRVQYFTPSGSYLGQWGSIGGTGPGEFQAAISAAVSPDGSRVYVGNNGLSDRVQYFSPTGVWEGEWGGGCDGDGKFNHIYVLATAADGTVYAGGYYDSRVQIFDADGEFLGVLGTGNPGTGNGDFNQPVSIGINPVSGNVYVADANNHRIQYFEADGTYLGQWSVFTAHGVTVDAHGHVYVATRVNTIQVHDLVGNLLG